MFDKVAYRYALRCVLYGLGAFVTAWAVGDWKDALIAGVSAALLYAGIGAGSTAIEPGIGRKRAIAVSATSGGSASTGAGVTSYVAEGVPR